MIYNKFVDDIFMFGRKQRVTRVHPCLKLYAGCPIINYGVNKCSKERRNIERDYRISQKHLKADRSLKEELWNNYKAYTIEDNDVD